MTDLFGVLQYLIDSLPIDFHLVPRCWEVIIKPSPVSTPVINSYHGRGAVTCATLEARIYALRFIHCQLAMHHIDLLATIAW